MLKSKFQNIIFALIAVSSYFAGRELFGQGIGWLVMMPVTIIGFFLALRLESQDSRSQLKAVAVTIVFCVALLFGSLKYNDWATKADLTQIQGTWEATTPKNQYVMQVEADSTYMSGSFMPGKVSYIMRLSQDSLILIRDDVEDMEFRLEELSAKTLRVSVDSKEMTFRKKP